MPVMHSFEEDALRFHLKSIIVRACGLEIGPDEIEDQEMLAQGILGLESLNVLTIITMVEEELGLVIPDEDITMELFDSINSLADYIMRRGPSAGNVAAHS